MGFVPDTWKTRPVVWAVKFASVVVPPMLVRQFISQRAGSLMLVGSMTSFAIDLIREFMPGVIPGLSGMGYQPMLGVYTGTRRTSRPAMAPSTARRISPIIANVPDRLSPTSRF
jgi:hypothetical protein